MAFRLYTSNRMEELVIGLAGLVGQPMSDEFASEIIVVQSRGMDRYLSLKLSQAHGVWANCRYPFPSAVIDQLCRQILPQTAVSELYERDVLTWRILSLLEREAVPAELSAYLERGGLRAYQLARNLADVFDQYQIFRPDLLSAWQAGQLLYAGAHGEAWQAQLWRELAASGATHRAALFQELLAALPQADKRCLPERLSLFGISYLPPVYLAIFATLAELIDVNVYSLSPCREYWADLVSLKEQARLEPAAYLNVGNSLLASLGRQSRAFFEHLSDYDAGSGGEVYLEAEASLLGAVQNEILRLEQPERAAHSAEDRRRQASADASIRVHSCHSRLRELEVLHDQLLDLLANEPALKPEEIVVMAPDIEAYAPYVAAVFEREPRLRFNISDRCLRRTSGAVDSFLKVLELSETRLNASAVLGLIESPAIADKLAFGPAELELVRRWITESGIRWGRDAEQRAALGLPSSRQNTWRAGLERLLIGYAVGGDEFSAGILPYEVEPDAAPVLGRLVDFCEQLFAFSELAGELLSLSAWQQALEDLLEALLPSGDEAQRLRAEIKDLGRLEQLSAYQAKLPLKVVRARLEERLNQEISGASFLAGGVTFCSLLPMRSIPFKVVCLLGLNHDEFPRRKRSSGFDLIARHPRRGDRNKRDDDLYLFLETLLAARQVLYLSYVGQSQVDGRPRPPSVLVNELLDYLGLDEEFVVQERLQAFSPAYFDSTGPYFSFSQAACRAAEALSAPSVRPVDDWPLAEPEASWRALSLSELIRFYKNPCLYLLEKRLGCQSARLEEAVGDREPFALEGLERYAARHELVRHFDERPLERLRAKGALPLGSLGDELYAAQRSAVAELVQAVAAYGAPASLRRFELALGGFNLNGALEVTEAGLLVASRPGRVRAVDRLELWLKLLALSAAGQPAKGVLLGLDAGLDCRTLAAPLKSAARLTELLELYWQGLHAPLNFFCETSAAYAASMLKDADEAKALSSARKVFDQSDYGPAEGEQPAVRRCFEGRTALDQAFRQTALAVWQPLIEQEAQHA